MRFMRLNLEKLRESETANGPLKSTLFLITIVD